MSAASKRSYSSILAACVAGGLLLAGGTVYADKGSADPAAKDSSDTAAQAAAPPESATTPSPDPAPAPNMMAQSEARIDSTRQRIEQILSRSSRWMDGLIGDNDPNRSAREPYGSIEVSDTQSQFYGNKPRIRFDARIDLPNTQHRLSGFIGRNDEDDFVRDRIDNSNLRSRFPRVDSQDQWLAGLGYSLPSNQVVQTDLRVGVRRLNPEAFVQGRVRYNAYADERNLVHFGATPFWTTHEGFGLTVGGDYSHVPSEHLLFRFSNVGTISESRKGLDWRSALTLYQAVHQYSGLAYEVFIRGETGDDVPLHEYGVQTTFRHPFLARRLYAEWVAGYSFPREDLSDHRRGSAQVGLGVEMPFGQRH